MTKFEVVLYEKENGECPVEEFITSLDMNDWFVGIIRRKRKST